MRLGDRLGTLSQSSTACSFEGGGVLLARTPTTRSTKTLGGRGRGGGGASCLPPRALVQHKEAPHLVFHSSQSTHYLGRYALLKQCGRAFFCSSQRKKRPPLSPSRNDDAPTRDQAHSSFPPGLFFKRRGGGQRPAPIIHTRRGGAARLIRDRGCLGRVSCPCFFVSGENTAGRPFLSVLCNRHRSYKSSSIVF